MKHLEQHTSEPQFARCSTTLTNTRPIFTHDSKYLVCAAGQTVRFYGVLSGEVVFEVKVHTDTITHLVVAPHNSRQLVTCGLDGRLVFIDSSDAQVLRVLQWRSPLHGVYFCSSKSQSKLRLILLSSNKRAKEKARSAPESSVRPGLEGTVADDLATASDYRKCVSEDTARSRYDCALHLFELDAERNELTQLSERPVFAEVSRDATRTGVDPRGNFLVTLRRRKMMVCTFKTDGKGEKAWEISDSFVYHAPIVHRAHAHIEFECLALHPTQTGCVVTGLSDGRMVIWWNVAERQTDDKDVKHASFGKKGGVKLPPRQAAKTATLHWHALPVGAVAYTPDGSFLLSGGLESVLVKWYQPETSRMDFLPRLGAPIRSLAVSPDASFYAVAHNDNAISLVQASVNGVVQSVHGLVGAHRYNRRLKAERFILPAGLHRDPVSNQLVLNGRIGLLQFYDPRADRCALQLDVVGENLISPENIDDADAQTWLTEVVCLAFSPRGSWLVTAESLVRSLMRDTTNLLVEDSAYSEVRLKFWKLRPDRSNFELATCIDMPHVGDVQVLQFGTADSQFYLHTDPDDDSCLTLASCGAQDGRVRLWKPVREADATDASWQCVASAAYRETRCVSACDFSADASLLAAVFDGDVTLFRTEPRFGRLELLAALESESNEAALSVHMLSRTWSHLLVAYATSLRLFDVLDCSCLWNYDLTLSNPNQINLCVMDKLANRFAVIDCQNVVTAFDCDSKTPLFTHCIPKSITNKQPLRAVFDNVDDPNLIRLYFTTLDCTVCSIEHRLNADNATPLADTSMAVDNATTRHEGTTQQESSKAKTPFELFVASYMRSTGSDRHSDTLRDRVSAAGERDYDAIVAQFVASPSHTLPNAAVMCHSLFTAALRLRPAESN